MIKNDKIISGSVLYLAAFTTQVIAQDTLPNVIYILADDLGYADISCQGQKWFNTPNIDKLAENGMRFTHHYSGSTVCAPSRSSLMTGQTTGHTYIRGNKNIELPAENVTVGEIFQAAGYVTGAFGKWGLGNPGLEGDPNTQGFDEFYGYISQSRAHRYYPDYIIYNGEKSYMPGNNWSNLVTYTADTIHNRALDFIDSNKNRPFFLFCPYTIPHVELIVPEDSIIEVFRDSLLPEKNYKGSDYKGPGTSEGGYCSQSECHATFAAMVTRLDIHVGQIVKKLEELGLTENTLIMFTSDNGPTDAGGADPDFFNGNGDFRGVKRDLYEGGIRVPFIASWPGKIKKGTISTHPSAFWDLLPTCADLVGQDTPEEVDGVSFLPEMLGEEQQDPDFLYWEFHENKKGGTKQAVRFDHWKGIRKNMQTNMDGPIELYNLKTDSTERTNIAARYPEIVAKMDYLMTTQRTPTVDFNFKQSTTIKPNAIDIYTLKSDAFILPNDTLQLVVDFKPDNTFNKKFSIKIDTLTPGIEASVNIYGELIVNDVEGSINVIVISDEDNTITDTLNVQITDDLSISTISAKAVSYTRISAKGEVLIQGSEPIEEMGFCYDTISNPTIDKNTIKVDSGATFYAIIDSLMPGKTYYIRAYAKNSQGILYGKEIEVKLNEEPVESVNKYNKNKRIKIVPNPIQNGFSIVLNGYEIKDQINIDILDLSGKLVYSNELSFNSLTDIDINIKSGYYIVKLTDGNHLIYNKKVFIK